MKKWLHKIYIFSLFGAFGGLTGSLLHQKLLLDVLSQADDTVTRLSYLAMLGVLVGAPIGFFLSFSEGLGRHALLGALRTSLVGAVLAAMGGMIALPLAELLHIHLEGGLRGRVIALGILGFGVGVAEGVNGGTRWRRSAAGGLVGGITGGVAVEFFVHRQATHADSGIIALIFIGFFIALFVAMFVSMLADAWLEGLPGSKVHGQIYHLSKFQAPREAVLGSDKKGAVFIWIPDAQARHAAIALTAKGARLHNLVRASETRVNGHLVQQHLLRDGEVIEIGTVKLRYRERRIASG